MKSKRFIAFFGIYAGLFAVAMDFSIVNTAIPIIQKSLQAPLSKMQWVMNAFNLFMCIFLVSMGRLGDLLGKKKMYLAGNALFSAGSLLGIFSSNIHYLITARALQGVGAAIIMPLSQVLITHLYQSNMRGKAMGLWATILGIGLAAGPVVGGILTSLFGWSSIFALSFVLPAISYIACLAALKKDQPIAAKTTIDYQGMALLLISLSLLIFCIIEAPSSGWLSRQTITLFCASAIGFLALVFVEKKQKSPIIAPYLFKNLHFFCCSMANFCSCLYINALFFLAPLFLQNIRMQTPYQVGLSFLAITVPIALFSKYTGQFTDLWGAKKIVFSGFIALLLSCLMQRMFTPSISLGFILLSFLVFGAGWAAILGPSASSGVAAAAKADAATASGMLLTLQEIGAGLGLALGGSIFRSVYQNRLLFFLQENDITLSQQDWTDVKNILADPNSVHSALQSMGHALQSQMLALFEKAFVQGYQSLMLFLGIVSVFGLFCSFGIRQKKQTKNAL